MRFQFITTTCICVLCILTSVNLTAQVQYGLKGGANLAYMNFDQKEMLVAYHAGVLVNIDISENLFLQPELLYSVKGVKLPDYFIDPFDMEITMSYLTLPALLGYRVTDRLTLKGGAEINYLTSATIKVWDDSSNDKQWFSDVEIGLDAGASLRLLDNLGIELRYCYGITKALDIQFTDANGQTLGGTGDKKNRALQLSLYYIFGKDAPDEE